MKIALLLGLINPNIGGILLIGPRGTAKTTAVRSLLELLPQVERSLCAYGCLPEDIEAGGIDAVWYPHLFIIIDEYAEMISDSPEFKNELESITREDRAQGKAEGRGEGKAESKAEGKAEGKAEAVLRLLTRRFGPLGRAVEAKVRSAGQDDLDAILDRVFTATTVDDALG